MKNKIKVANIDREHLRIIRKSVSDFLKECSNKYDTHGKLLDIAPQDHEGANPYFKKANIYTLDIDTESGADYIADICKNNEDKIPNDYFDLIVCTEVLEHTLNPFNAVKEIKRILKPGGFIFITVPFNFRIHGPLPDCWRFTEHGLRALFNNLNIIEMDNIKTPGRDLMPIHYRIILGKE